MVWPPNAFHSASANRRMLPLTSAGSTGGRAGGWTRAGRQAPSPAVPPGKSPPPCTHDSPAPDARFQRRDCHEAADFGSGPRQDRPGSGADRRIPEAPALAARDRGGRGEAAAQRRRAEGARGRPAAGGDRARGARKAAGGRSWSPSTSAARPWAAGTSPPASRPGRNRARRKSCSCWAGRTGWRRTCAARPTLCYRWAR